MRVLSEVVVIRGFLVAATTTIATIGLSSRAMAQERQTEPEVLPGIPTAALPPEGMCRVWLREVPVNRQPAPTDCASAIKTRPRDAILLIGDQGKNARGPVRSPVSALPWQQRFGSPAVTAPRTVRRPVRPVPTTAVNGEAVVKAPETKAAVVAKPPE